MDDETAGSAAALPDDWAPPEWVLSAHERARLAHFQQLYRASEGFHRFSRRVARRLVWVRWLVDQDRLGLDDRAPDTNHTNTHEG